MKVKLTKRAHKQLKRLDKAVKKRITLYLEEVEKLENPRSRAKLLTGGFAGLWRFRVGDYRIICDIVDVELTIYAIEIGHRREIYF